jgi:hypothetical protein
MHTFVIILLSLALIYLLGVAAIFTVSLLVIRRSLRKFQQTGRFGY